MRTREQIEIEINLLLQTETRTTVLSNQLFQQETGLFAQLASSQEERSQIVQTELFRRAQARVRDLQYRDASALAEAYQTLKEKLPESRLRVGAGLADCEVP